MENRNHEPQRAEEHYGRHIFDRPRIGAGRVFAYFLAMIVLNVMLAVYSLYILGFTLAFDWSKLTGGTLQAILESLAQLLLFFSPVILTIVLNRLLYRAFRGRGRFPRGIGFFALLMIVAVQAAVIAIIFGYGYAGGVGGFQIESISSQPLN
jgi:hypothetical protein